MRLQSGSLIRIVKELTRIVIGVVVAVVCGSDNPNPNPKYTVLHQSSALAYRNSSSACERISFQAQSFVGANHLEGNTIGFGASKT